MKETGTRMFVALAAKRSCFLAANYHPLPFRIFLQISIYQLARFGRPNAHSTDGHSVAPCGTWRSLRLFYPQFLAVHQSVRTEGAYLPARPMATWSHTPILLGGPSLLLRGVVHPRATGLRAPSRLGSLPRSSAPTHVSTIFALLSLSRGDRVRRLCPLNDA